MMHDYVNKAVEIMLNLAKLTDEKQETPFEHDMGLGYRAFSSYFREGCQGIIDLQSEYYRMKESKEYAQGCLKTNEECLEEVFGSTEVPEFNDEEKAKIKAVVEEILKSWERCIYLFPHSPNSGGLRRRWGIWTN